MNNRNLIIGLVLLAVVAGGGGWWWQSRAETASGDTLLEATGVIEARQVSLAPEMGGQVVEVLVEEGQRVAAGQLLVRLDDSLLLTQRAQAQAALQAAQANLALLKAGATANQIKAAEAQLAQAEVNLRMAQASLDALTAGSRPEEIAAIRASLDRVRAEYRTMEVAFTNEQIEKARSALTTAEGNLSEAMARRDELAKDTRNPAYTIAAADAAVTDAQAAVAVARQAYEAVRDESQPYYRQIELVRLSWEVAQANLTQAQARRSGLLADSRTTPEALQAAEAIVKDAQDQLDAAKAAYEDLVSGASALQLDAAWDEVQRAQAQLAAFGMARQSASTVAGEAGSVPSTPFSVETLIAQVEAATALRDMAAANLSELKNGARQEEIDAAQAQVDAAQAQLDALDVQLEKFTITAPWDGVVLTRSAEPGQTVMPGATLLEIGRLDLLKLTVYLAEDRFGLITPGQVASVRVDAYPGRAFSGTVLRVSDEAEFTPTNVQTKEDRVRLVYAVVISLDNPDLALKPGMIADVEFEQ